MEPKRILIACPTLGLDPDPNKWLTSLLMIVNDIRRNKMSHACYFPYKETWWPANNGIWDIAFQNEFDYILRLDDDIWGVPPNAFSHLVEADKDVIGAAYPIRQFPYSICAYRRSDDTLSLVDIWKSQNRMGLEDIKGTGIQPVDLVGFGMTLIKVAPFRLLDRPMYQGEANCPDDTYFAQKCLDNGIQQYVHMDVKLCHREVTPHNRVFLFNADARAMIAQGAIVAGTKFNDTLIEEFGENGLKDLNMIKGLERSPILTAR